MTEMRSVLVIVILGLFLVGCGGAPSSSTLPGAGLEGDKAAERNLHPDKVERGLVILLEFPGLKNRISMHAARSRFEKLADYVSEMSYGRVRMETDLTGRWLQMPHPVERYRISPRNLEVDKSRIQRLIDDALALADPDVDFSRYSFTALFMAAKRTEYGMIGLCGYPGMLGWQGRRNLRTPSGQIVQGGIAIFTFQAHQGTLFHDVAHVLGGVRVGKRMVPCLYDHDLQAKPGNLRDTFLNSMVNVGFWDPMSCHFVNYNQPPPGITSWTRIRLGWMDEGKVRTVDPQKDTELILEPLETEDAELLAVRIPLTETTFYLVENRQPIGYDRNLPAHGVLVMYCDDAVSECRYGKAPVKLVNANPKKPHLTGAAFNAKDLNEFVEPRKRFRIAVVEELAGSYRIRIGPVTP